MPESITRTVTLHRVGFVVLYERYDGDTARIFEGKVHLHRPAAERELDYAMTEARTGDFSYDASARSYIGEVFVPEEDMA